MSSDVVIDLGLNRPPGQVPRAHPPRRLPPRLLLAVAVLLALLPSGSVPPAGGPLAQLYSLPLSANPQYVLDHDTLYVTTVDAVAAYRLRDGRQRWRTPLTEPIYGLVPDYPSGTLLSLTDGSASASVEVFDMDTGALLWRRSGVTGQSVPGGGSVALFSSTDSLYQPRLISGVDVHTGDVRWLRVTPPLVPQLAAVDTAPDGTAGLVAVFGSVDAGRPDPTMSLAAERIDLSSGVLTADTSLTDQVPALAAADPATRQVSGLVGGLLLVVAQTTDGARGYGFDAVSLQLRWTSVLPGYSQYATDCGPSICLYGDAGTVLLDPATGLVRAAADWHYAVPLPDGRFLAQADTVTVVDPQLRPVLPLGLWQVVATSPVPLLQRPGPDPADTWIGLLDAAPTRIRLLGRLRVGAVDSCATDGTYLVCRVASAGLVTFALRSGGAGRR